MLIYNIFFHSNLHEYHCEIIQSPAVILGLLKRVVSQAVHPLNYLMIVTQRRGKKKWKAVFRWQTDGSIILF